MRLLLDENLDWRLGRDLPGHQTESVSSLGWTGIQNGELLAKADEAGFAALVTMDSNMVHQQNVGRYAIAVVALRARSNRAIDLAQRWRVENRSVISGFHTPVEKECFRIFLRGPQRIVICPARGLDPFQLPPDWQQKFKCGELLIVSPFDSSIHRPTKETAELRTRLVLSLAQSKTIIHASRGGFLSRLIAGSIPT